MLDPSDTVPATPQRRLAVAPDATIADLLRDGSAPSFSFEFFPPKNDAGHAQLQLAIERLKPLRPDFVSVTYGANGSSRDRTQAAVRDIVATTDVGVMGHLTCTGQTVDELKEAIDAYGEIGIRHILAVRGDMPGGPSTPWEPVEGGLKNATELVELVRSRGDFCVGVGAFPDVHPSGSAELDAQLLVDKYNAGASFAITQLFFTPRRYFEMVDRVRSRGCPIPVVAGLMPVTNIRQIDKFAELSGCSLPEAVVTRLQGVADDAEAVRAVGVEIGVELGGELLDGGVPGIHFFTQNHSRATTDILTRLLARSV